jgi:hypothetical protein
MTTGSAAGAPAIVRPVRRDRVLGCPAAGELVLYDGRKRQAISLNLSAAAIWDMCDGSRTVSQIAAELAELTSQPRHAIEAEVCAVIEQLQGLRVIELQSGGPFE